jgi:hypothetical protein
MSAMCLGACPYVPVLAVDRLAAQRDPYDAVDSACCARRLRAVIGGYTYTTYMCYIEKITYLAM